MQNLCCFFSRAVCTHVGGPNNFGDVWAPPLLGQGVTRDCPPPLETRSWPTCYTKFCRCMSNRLGVGTGVAKVWGRWSLATWGGGVDTPRKMLLSICVTMPNLVILGQTVRT